MGRHPRSNRRRNEEAPGSGWSRATVHHTHCRDHRVRTRSIADVRVSTRGDYASRALLSLALHGGETPTSVRDIAERTGLPQPYLEQILLALKGAGLVKSKRGVGGGYVLARATTAIKLADIIRAVDGPIQVGDFGEPHTNGACDHEGQCVLLNIWNVVGEHMRGHLESWTLADMTAQARGEQTWPEAPHAHA
jgi:Rrf2 family protein